MPIPFQCPHCGLRTQVAERLAGQSGPCRQCGQAVTVPHLSGPMQPPVQIHGGYGLACPRCGSQSIVAGSWPWYLGTIGAIFVSARLCTHCGHEFDARKPNADFRKRKLRLALVINGLGALGILLVVFLVGLVAYLTSR
jgi:DNA-directed RNA polymerase subunit RPC12/RpoP